MKRDKKGRFVKAKGAKKMPPRDKKGKFKRKTQRRRPYYTKTNYRPYGMAPVLNRNLIRLY